MDYADHRDRVQRARETESRVRASDVPELVAWIHSLEDREAELVAALESLLDAVDAGDGALQPPRSADVARARRAID